MNDPVVEEADNRDSELDKLVAACQSRLPAPATWAAFPGYPDSLALALVDAIWSPGIRYATTAAVVGRYAEHRRLVGTDPAHDTVSGLLSTYEGFGSTERFIDAVGTRHRVSTQSGAALKGAVVRQAAESLRELGIDTADQFRAADQTPVGKQAESAWRALPGQRSGISWRYLRMLLGLADVKPDRMVTRFVAAALGVSEASLAPDRVALLVQAAAAHHAVDAGALDHKIWKYQTSQPSTQEGTPADHLKALAIALSDRCLPILAEQHVIPTSRFQPFIQVGRHYQGSDVMYRPEFRELEAALERQYPHRFANPRRPNAEFVNGYIFGYIEAVVARRAGDDWDPTVAEQAAARSADELIRVLESEQYDLMCCRAVTHLTTSSGDDERIGNVSVYPEKDLRGIDSRTRSTIPAADTAFAGELPFIFGPPHSLLVSKVTVQNGKDPYVAARRASAAIDRFMLLARLLHAGTHQSGWQVIGATSLIARVRPKSRTFVAGTADPRIQRTVQLSASDAPALAALSQYIDAAVVKREGMVTTSFDTAVHLYNRAHESGDDFERIIDLATALEAVLTGEDKGEGLSLRLRIRAAALLATQDDSGHAIFKDIGLLYDLRSRLVHGGSIPEKDLRDILRKTSTIPNDAMFGVALAQAVDRLRDLVRRSFLARLCLAAGPEPLWPFGKSTAVDAALADDTSRLVWRTQWRDRLTGLGISTAADTARPLTDPLAQHDTD